MKNRRFLAVLTAMSMIIGLTACAGRGTEGNTGNESTAQPGTEESESQEEVAADGDYR